MSTTPTSNSGTGGTAVTTPLPGAQLPTERMPGHWLLARLGKRVLRPGGVGLTNQLLDGLAIDSTDDVVEVAPGLGSTTRLVIERGPATYRGVERDAAAADSVRPLLRGAGDSLTIGSATETGLPDASADALFGEAYLTMQPPSQKEKILTEIARVVRPGGRLGMHEIAFAPDDISESKADAVASELGSQIKVHVAPLSISAWTELLDRHGFDVEARYTAPLHLLEPKRLVADEGLGGALRFARNVARDSDARQRVLGMRRVMRANAANLQAIAIVATRRAEPAPAAANTERRGAEQ